MAEWEPQSRSRDRQSKGIGFKTNIPHSALLSKTLGPRQVQIRKGGLP